MSEYDAALKSVLQRLTGSVLEQLTGFKVSRWHNVELPAVQNRRADMLGETGDGVLVHIELQSTNQTFMALRMLEYATAIHRRFDRFPQQIVLYVGQSRLRMRARIEGPALDYSFRIIDIRTLDCEPLIASSHVEDNVIAVLARLRNERDAVRRILHRIAGSAPQRRTAALAELMLLAGLRDLGPTIEREVKQMPILNDIMDHPVLGRERKRGIQMGLERGLQRERQTVLRMVNKRFGPVPAAVRQRIEAFSAAKLERTALRLLDANSLEDALK